MANSKDPNGIPSGLELVELREFLITKLGYTPQQAGQAMGQTAGKTRRQNADHLKGWQHDQ